MTIRKRTRGNSEGSIRKIERNGKVTGYEATVTVSLFPKQRRKTKSFKTRAEAVSWIATVKAEAATGKQQRDEGEGMTLDALFDRFIARKEMNSLSPNTLRSYRSLGRLHIRPRLGQRPIVALKPVEIDAFVQDLHGQGQSPQNIRHILAVLKMALAYAVELELLSANPAAKIRAPRAAYKETKVWRPDEAATFLAVAESHRLYALFYLALVTGMRRGELLGLHWENVELERGLLKVRQTLTEVNGQLSLKAPKTRQSRRSITLPSDAVKVLEDHRQRQNAEQAYLLGSWQDERVVFASDVGSYLDPSNMVQAFKRLIRKAGVPELRFHDLRHTATTLLLLRNVPIKVVSDRLGHADPGFTLQRYAHVLDEQRQEAALSLEEMLGANLSSKEP